MFTALIFTVFQVGRSDVVETNTPQSLDLLHARASLSLFISLAIPEVNKCDDTRRILNSAAKIRRKIYASRAKVGSHVKAFFSPLTVATNVACEAGRSRGRRTKQATRSKAQYLLHINGDPSLRTNLRSVLIKLGE